MGTASQSILLAALGVGFLHTLLGPDHTLPFIMLARARHWSWQRTLGITFLCGLGHVGSSLVLGSIGLALGFGMGELQGAEMSRGRLAAWALVAIGVAYALWGIRRGWVRRSGMVLHEHAGEVHLHTHGLGNHKHSIPTASEPSPEGRSVTFWALFAVFVLGPCEPLIPLFLVPASTGDWKLAAAVSLVFSAITVATMLTVVALGLAGVKSLPFGAMERWADALAGGVIAASGLAIVFLGL